MSNQLEQNLYPIQALDMFESMLSEQQLNAEEQYQSLCAAINNPYKLDDETVERVKRLYESEAEIIALYKSSQKRRFFRKEKSYLKTETAKKEYYSIWLE